MKIGHRRVTTTLTTLLVVAGIATLVAAQHKAEHELTHEMIGLYSAPGSARGGEDLIEPPVLHATNGRLNVDLIVRYENHTLGSSAVRMRTYVDARTGRAALYGPTLRIGPDDHLTINIENDLPANIGMGHPHNVPHDFNSTNLHTHGLHVSPLEDDIFRRIDPLHTGRYSYQLERHFGGTHWYHPHLHGSTAIQVASGMSGALIVEGDFEHIPQIKNARERVLIFNQIMFTTIPPGPGELERYDELFNLAIKPPEGTTINSQVKPVIRMRPGEVQRWRIIDSGFRDLLAFRLDQHEFHQIAVDGLPLAGIRTTPTIAMAPGNRTDVLVQACAKPGDYLLKPVTYNFADEYDLGGNAPARSRDSRESADDYLAIVRIEGDAKPDRLPTSLAGARRPASLTMADVSNAAAHRSIDFTATPDPAHMPADPAWLRIKFGVNGSRYDDLTISQFLQLGTNEIWELKSTGNHPFHIHTNPFLVTEVDGRRLVKPVWKDVVLIPGGAGVRVKMLTRYEDYDGDAVLHCHILTHEDAGMMQRIRFKR